MRRLLCAVLLGLTLSAAACGTTDNVRSSSTAQARVADEAHRAETAPRIGKGSVGYDGFKVSIPAARVVTRDAYAAGGRATDRVIAVSVKIRTAEESFNPTAAIVSLTYGPDGTQAERVFQDGLDGSFNAPIPHHSAATARFGFAVPRRWAAKDITVSVTPAFGLHTAAFAGRAKN